MRIPAFLARLWRNWVVGMIVFLEGYILLDTTFPLRDLAAQHRRVASFFVMGVGMLIIIAALLHAVRSLWRPRD
jgi:uncharacterized membrane protein